MPEMATQLSLQNLSQINIFPYSYPVPVIFFFYRNTKQNRAAHFTPKLYCLSSVHENILVRKFPFSSPNTLLISCVRPSLAKNSEIYFIFGPENTCSFCFLLPKTNILKLVSSGRYST